MIDKIDKKYSLLFNKLDKLNKEDDNEGSHILQDTIYRKFITDINNNKIKDIEHIKKIAKNMNKYVVKKDKNRWYA
jgi:hypothetical protein